MSISFSTSSLRSTRHRIQKHADAARGLIADIRTRAWWTQPRILTLVGTLIAIAPLIYAAVLLISQDWWPSGDDALIAIRAHDVFSGHLPVMGQRSTSGFTDAAAAVHHPGPLEFYVFGIIAFFAGFEPWGLVLAGLLVNGYACLLAVRTAARYLGPAAVCGVIILMTYLCAQWTATLLIRPYNLTANTLPLAALLVLFWAVMAAPRSPADTPPAISVVPHAAFLWCYVVQTHLAHLVTGGVLLIAAVAVGVARVLVARSTFRPRRKSARPLGKLWRGHPVRQGIVVAVICWLPVMVELLTYHPNELTHLFGYLDFAGSQPDRGWTKGFDLISHTMLPVPPSNPFFLLDQPHVAAAGGLLALLLLLASVTGLYGAVHRRLYGRTLFTAHERMLLVGAQVGLLSLYIAALGARTLEDGRPAFYASVYLPLTQFAAMTAILVLIGAARSAIEYFAPVVGRILSHGIKVLPVAWLTIVGLALGCVSAGIAIHDTPAALSGANRPLDASTGQALAAIRKRVPAHTPINIITPGLQGYTTYGPTMAYRTLQAGYPTTFKIIWPFKQDDDFHKNQFAPKNAWILLVHETNGGVPTSGPITDATPVTHFTFTAGLGFPEADIEVYLLPPGSAT